jgi:hypothetical protein
MKGQAHNFKLGADPGMIIVQSTAPFIHRSLGSAANPQQILKT